MKRVKPSFRHKSEISRPRLSASVLSGLVRCLDAAVIFFCGIVAASVYQRLTGGSTDLLPYPAISAAVAVVVVYLIDRQGGYRMAAFRDFRAQCLQASTVWLLVVMALIAIAFLTKTSEQYSRGWGLCWLLLTPGAMFLVRGGTKLAVWAAGNSLGRRVAVIGTGAEAADFLARARIPSDEPIEVVGVFSSEGDDAPDRLDDVRVLGGIDDLIAMARRETIDEIVVALPLSCPDRLNRILHLLRVLPIDIRLAVGGLALHAPDGTNAVSELSYIGKVPVLHVAERPLKHWNGFAKWLEDKILAVLFLVALWPVMLAAAIAIKLDSRGPVLFSQQRFGLNNRPIKVLKFRSMYVEQADPTGQKQTVRGDVRVTRVGRWLRASSLDELPQLFNILRGDMSFVGPRPHAITMKAGEKLYHDVVDDYFLRHRVRPGLTGWAQVNGSRGEIDTMEKATARIRLDIHYIDNWSILLDLKIILMSVRAVMLSRQAY